MKRKTLNLSDPLYDYLLANSLRESPVLAQLRRETAELPGARMQITPHEGQFLALLCQLIGARRVLEIGTFTGYSSLVMAEALPANGELITCDQQADTAQIAQRYWQQAGLAHKIKFILGDALSTLNELIANPQQPLFDFIFIDADKNNYSNYYELSLQLVRHGGIIAIDNVLWGGAVADTTDRSPQTASIRLLNSQLHQDQRISLSMLPVGDGLTLAMKR